MVVLYRRCDICQGTGVVGDVNGYKKMSARGIKCPVCGGLGRIERMTNIE